MKLINLVTRDIRPEDVKPPYNLNTAKEPTRFHRTTSWKFVEYVDMSFRDGRILHKESTPEDPIYVSEGWRGYNNQNNRIVEYYFFRPCHKDMNTNRWLLLKEGGEL